MRNVTAAAFFDLPIKGLQMKILSVLAIAALVVNGGVGAADNKVAASEPAPAADQSGQQETQIGTPAQVFGKIVSMHNCSLAGMSDPHLLVKLESAPGDVEVVDLGSVAELKSNGIEPREGQQFWIDGRVGKINDDPIVVAERLSESKLITITRQASLREETKKDAEGHHIEAATNEVKDVKEPKTETLDAGQQQICTIEGTILNTHRLKVDGHPHEHVLAKIQTENGIVVVDLGPSNATPKVNLSDGQSVAATGFIGHLNGKPIILADSVGNLSSIQNSDQPEIAPSNTSVHADKNEECSGRN